MTEKTTFEILRELEFLTGIADEYLQKIAALATLESHDANVTVFREGDPASNIYLVIEGKISLEICAAGIGCRQILTVSQGDLLGWSPVLEQSRLTATARTLTPTQLLRIPGSQIVTLCEHNPRFGYEFMRRAAIALAKRLTAARVQLLDVYGPGSGNQQQEGGA
ncbi:MAG: Crp/Fnr family transcriptional regulator [Pirellulaceae bacterium]|nr:Crp/Fnr family transcriptional regulator [Planctomycetales bacterium]MCA9265192.1 Crp/Fnr family transcriptional regulator [Planctomycetales bacterium]